MGAMTLRPQRTMTKRRPPEIAPMGPREAAEEQRVRDIELAMYQHHLQERVR